MRITLTLNGRPLFVGSKLKYKDQEMKEMWGDDYLIVTGITQTNLTYEGSAGEVSGTVSAKELPNTFVHHEDENEKSNEYLIAHITDLITIPDDRLDACLDGLKDSIRAVRLSITAGIVNAEEQQNIKFTDEDKKLFVREVFGSVTWIDDGENTQEVRQGGETLLTITRVEADDKFDLDRGDNEYFLVVDGETKRHMNAYDQEEASAKARHHYGLGATAVWRKYVGE